MIPEPWTLRKVSQLKIYMLCQGAYCRRREKSLWAGPTQKKGFKKKASVSRGLIMI